MDWLLNRRSIRKYTDQPVSDEQINNMIKAAMYAPSAGNQQVWHFVVITDRDILNAIIEFHPHAQMLKQAKVAILVCADEQLETKVGYWHIDCAAATENLLLAAHGMGLGAVWLGICPRPERMEGMSQLLNLPENIKPFSLVSVGYPAEERRFPDRFKPERIHQNKW